MKKRSGRILLAGLATALLAFSMPGPAQAYDNWRNPSCQDFTRTTYYTGGRFLITHGTACVQRDGTWRVVSEEGPILRPSIRERVVYTPQPYFGFGYYYQQNDWNRYDHSHGRRNHWDRDDNHRDRDRHDRDDRHR
jgi:hypothetical protein